MEILHAPFVGPDMLAVIDRVVFYKVNLSSEKLVCGFAEEHVKYSCCYD